MKDPELLVLVNAWDTQKPPADSINVTKFKRGVKSVSLSMKLTCKIISLTVFCVDLARLYRDSAGLPRCECNDHRGTCRETDILPDGICRFCACRASADSYNTNIHLECTTNKGCRVSSGNWKSFVDRHSRRWCRNGASWKEYWVKDWCAVYSSNWLLAYLQLPSIPWPQLNIEEKAF